MIVIGFIIKDPIAEFMYKNLPFFDFGGIFKGISVLNIAVYEILAFLIAVTILVAILEALVYATSVFEKILKWTIVLGFPSKILGALVGLIENFIIAFIVLYITTLPTLNLNIKSGMKDMILEKTPILSGFVDKSLLVINEFAELKEKYEHETDSNKFNRDTLDLFLKYDITNVKAVDVLVEKGKIKIEGIDEVLNKYRKD